MYYFSPKTFPKWAIYVSIVLTLITVLATLFSVLPLFDAMQSSGFNPETYAKLVSVSTFFQIIPAGIVCLLNLFLLNIYLQTIKPTARWLFITELSTIWRIQG